MNIQRTRRDPEQYTINYTPEDVEYLTHRDMERAALEWVKVNHPEVILELEEELSRRPDKK